MKKNVVLLGVLGSVLMFGSVVCYAAETAKWDKNDYKDTQVASGYYDAKSIKTEGEIVSWTEKYIMTEEGITFFNDKLSKHDVCKKSMESNGKVTQFQLDYQIKKKMYRGVAKRYYNKANKLVCTDKDTGNDFKSEWTKIIPRSPMMTAKYDLVSKYKVKFH